MNVGIFHGFSYSRCNRPENWKSRVPESFKFLIARSLLFQFLRPKTSTAGAPFECRFIYVTQSFQFLSQFKLGGGERVVRPHQPTLMYQVKP